MRNKFKNKYVCNISNYNFFYFNIFTYSNNLQNSKKKKEHKSSFVEKFGISSKKKNLVNLYGFMEQV